MEKKKFDFEDFAKKAADELRSGSPWWVVTAFSHRF
jgi:hypothetical protein